MGNENENVQLNKIMHEVYSTISSIKDVLGSALSVVDKYNCDRRVIKNDLLEISDMMNNLDMYLKYWQSVGESVDYYKVTMTNPEFNIFSFFKKPNVYFQKRMNKFRLQYQFEPSLPEWKFPLIEGYPTLAAVSNILFDNAVKYSLPDSTIQCELDASDDYVEIKFSNYGPYLLEQEYESVFDLGKRGKYADVLGKQGSGYGLNFLKSIVRAHYGKVTLSSEYGGKINDIPYGTFTCDIKLPLTLPYPDEDDDDDDYEDD